MYVCMYVCVCSMYVCLCVCMHVCGCMYVCLYACLCVYVCMYDEKLSALCNMYVCMCVGVGVCMYVCLEHVCMRARINVRKYEINGVCRVFVYVCTYGYVIVSVYHLTPQKTKAHL